MSSCLASRRHAARPPQARPPPPRPHRAGAGPLAWIPWNQVAPSSTRAPLASCAGGGARGDDQQGGEVAERHAPTERCARKPPRRGDSPPCPPGLRWRAEAGPGMVPAERWPPHLARLRAPPAQLVRLQDDDLHGVPHHGRKRAAGAEACKSSADNDHPAPRGLRRRRGVAPHLLAAALCLVTVGRRSPPGRGPRHRLRLRLRVTSHTPRRAWLTAPTRAPAGGHARAHEIERIVKRSTAPLPSCLLDPPRPAYGCARCSGWCK